MPGVCCVTSSRLCGSARACVPGRSPSPTAGSRARPAAACPAMGVSRAATPSPLTVTADATASPAPPPVPPPPPATAAIAARAARAAPRAVLNRIRTAFPLSKLLNDSQVILGIGARATAIASFAGDRGSFAPRLPGCIRPASTARQQAGQHAVAPQEGLGEVRIGIAAGVAASDTVRLPAASSACAWAMRCSRTKAYTL